MNSEPQILELPPLTTGKDELLQAPDQNGPTLDFSDRDDPAVIQHPQSDIQDPASASNPAIQQSIDPSPPPLTNPAIQQSIDPSSSHPAFGTGNRGNGFV